MNLPAGVPASEFTAEVRVPVFDRPGVLAEVTTLLGEMGINIYDLEIAHSAEGDRGVLVLVIDAAATERVRDVLHQRDFRSSSGHSDRDGLTVPRPGGLHGRLRVPGDKSISHRALLLAARAEGRSRLIGLSTGLDVRCTARAIGLRAAV